MVEGRPPVRFAWPLANDSFAGSVRDEWHLEAQRAGRAASDPDPADPFVHAAVMMRRAQRRSFGNEWGDGFAPGAPAARGAMRSLRTPSRKSVTVE
jgi:hypothetical protein